MYSTTEIERDELFAGSHPPIEMFGVVANAGTELKRGTCLGKNSTTGKLKIWDTTKDDGTEVLYGILANDVVADADKRVTIYVHGEFNANYLTAAQTVAPGIYGMIVIKENK
ncbi:MAG TPA: head decoration protein [Candidatus Kapabacteria bacterium]|nr:head decoration protein [Candidatus Kapabacteria bacterium]